MQISAKIIADTESSFTGKRITSLQLVMPRFILAQFNKHRVFSNNALSSRAIPVKKLLEQVRNDYVQPIFWGKNKSGMGADEELSGEQKELAQEVWYRAAMQMADAAEQLTGVGLAKEAANRLLEPFMWEHVIVTATEWDNFFNLRLAHDSQREMQALARAMKDAMDVNTPDKSRFHLPYITMTEILEWQQSKGITTAEVLYDAYKYFAPISAARCARVSYLNHDQSAPSFEKDMALAERLLAACHVTCFEHQAHALNYPHNYRANFIGWQSYRYDLEHAGEL